MPALNRLNWIIAANTLDARCQLLKSAPRSTSPTMSGVGGNSSDLDFDLFRDLDRIVEFDAEVANRTFDLGMS